MTPERWTILRVLEWTHERFARGQIAAPRLDAEVLLAAVLEVERIRLYVDYAKPLGENELAAFRRAIRRRLAGEPVAYIVGHREFWSLDLTVGPGVLVPRPETEHLVEEGLRWIASHEESRPEPRIVDVGTGSCAVALAIAHEKPQARVLATDVDAIAIAIAQKNIRRHNARVALIQADLLAPLPPASCDIILSNPPYIETGALEGLPRDVRDYEPRRALDGGVDGLVLVRRLVTQAWKCLRPDGLLAFEIGATQGTSASALCKSAGFVDVTVRRDLAGHDRVVMGTRP
ncbi:MAG: peptide chain release factor N(5)-glutamine methyltransferase [Deltaproteobacteria bacterium]|nr:peptide chain release factor N(5)-glutamine methyltransferase [Deltaproteobacteria bacterium]